MLYSKIFVTLLFMPVLFATSNSEAVIRCQKIHDTAQKEISALNNSGLVKVSSEALDIIKDIIQSFAHNSDSKNTPTQIKRCVALGDMIQTIKEELAKKQPESTKKSAEKEPEAAKNEESLEGKTRKKRKQKLDAEAEDGAVNLSTQLKAIAEESKKQSKKTSKPVL